MEALALPHLSQTPHQDLYSHALKAVKRFESCQVSIREGSLRILPLDKSTIAIEGVSSQGNRRLLLLISPNEWTLDKSTSAQEFQKKLGDGDAPLKLIAHAISTAFRTGRIQKISNDYTEAVRQIRAPKVNPATGQPVTTYLNELNIPTAWHTLNTVLQSPTTSKRMHRPISDAEGVPNAQLHITYEELKNRFVLDMRPDSQRFDSSAAPSITITKESISYFDPDGAEPFGTREQALRVFTEWMELWEKADKRRGSSKTLRATRDIEPI